MIVGNFYDSADNPTCFLRDPAGTFTAYTIPLTVFTTCEGINDNGRFVGSFKTATQTGWYSANATGPITILPDVATAINNLGTIVGGSVITDASGGKTTIQLGSSLYPPVLYGINSTGEAAGVVTYRLAGYVSSTGFFRASTGTTTDRPAYAFGLNDLRQVVGSLGPLGSGDGYVTATCITSIAPAAPTFGPLDTTGSILVTAPANCGYKITAENSWLTVGGANSVDFQFGTHTVPLTFPSNASTSLGRSVTIKIGDRSVTITQAGAPCSFVRTGGTTTFDANGGDSSISVSSPLGCNWSASSTVPWIAVNAGGSPSGSGQASYRVAPNFTNSSRTGNITVAGTEYVIAQAAAAGCSFSLGTVGATVTLQGGPISISVVASGPACTWTTNGNGTFVSVTTGQSGQGSGTTGLSVPANPQATTRFASVTIAGQPFIVTQLGSAATPSSRFIPITPCRVADTRSNSGFSGEFGAPFLSMGTSRDFALAASNCGVPGDARAYSLNVTVVPLQPLSYVTAWPTGQAQPYVSTLNSPDAGVVANAALVPAGNGGAISIYASDATDVVLDISGYFVDSARVDALAFFPIDPCRAVDTRSPNGLLGGPAFQGAGLGRDFPILASPCGLSNTARAYSFNFTAVPNGNLAYLTAWPVGQPRPLVSTLNSPKGRVLAKLPSHQGVRAAASACTR